MNSWLIFNAEEQHNVLRGTRQEGALREIVQELKRVNPLFQQLAILGQYPRHVSAGLRIHGHVQRTELAIVRASAFSTSQASCLYIWRQHDRSYNVPIWCGIYEPLAFPLFHVYGEQGWDSRLHRAGGPTILQYTRARLLIPENIWIRSITGEVIAVNRFQLMARLMQLYVLEQFARYIDTMLEFYRGDFSRRYHRYRGR